MKNTIAKIKILCIELCLYDQHPNLDYSISTKYSIDSVVSLYHIMIQLHVTTYQLYCVVLKFAGLLPKCWQKTLVDW